jgi:hypothetical protein
VAQNPCLSSAAGKDLGARRRDIYVVLTEGVGCPPILKGEILVERMNEAPVGRLSMRGVLFKLSHESHKQALLENVVTVEVQFVSTNKHWGMEELFQNPQVLIVHAADLLQHLPIRQNKRCAI